MKNFNKICMQDYHGLQIGDVLQVTSDFTEQTRFPNKISGVVKSVYIDKCDDTKTYVDLIEAQTNNCWTFVLSPSCYEGCYLEYNCEEAWPYTIENLSENERYECNVKNIVDNGIKVLQAYKNGKKIQIKGKLSEEWIDFDNRCHRFFDFNCCDYRVKE